MRKHLIGITGRLGSGKTTVLRMLAELGAGTLDADGVVHKLLRRDTQVGEAVVEEFGESILDASDNIDRRRLGRIVFSDPKALARLEDIVHPAVIEETVGWTRSAPEPVLAVEAVKLVESGMHHRFDAVWLVTADPDTVRRRLLRRDELSATEIDARLSAQGSGAAKREAADVIIDNSGSKAETRVLVARAWARIPASATVG
ncbi:MAG: dephospho-CoA kinase [Anaerolineae bacterium]